KPVMPALSRAGTPPRSGKPVCFGSHSTGACSSPPSRKSRSWSVSRRRKRTAPPQEGTAGGAGIRTRRVCPVDTSQDRGTALRLRLDEAVATVAPAVDDVHLAALRVLEDEEVVPDELELEHCLLRAHGLDRELLRLHDHRLGVVGRRSRSLQRPSVVTRGPPPALLPVAGHLALELVDELVDRRPHVGGCLTCPQRRPLRPDRGLGDVVRRDRRVPLHAELELDLRRIGQLSLELPELLFRVAANRVADVEVLALHLESHQLSFSREAGRVPRLNLTDG